MAYSNDQTLGEVIREFLKQYNLEGKIEERKLLNSWPSIVGPMIERHTRNLYIKNRILFVKLDSPALTNELSYAREKITKSLNEAVGSEVIKDVKFV